MVMVPRARIRALRRASISAARGKRGGANCTTGTGGFSDEATEDDEIGGGARLVGFDWDAPTAVSSGSVLRIEGSAVLAEPNVDARRRSPRWISVFSLSTSWRVER